jgi:hypothetical protein
MSKVFSKLKRTTISELIDSANQRSITSVEIAQAGNNYAVDDVFEIAGRTVLKVTSVAALSSNAVSSINVVSSGTYTNLTALSNVAVYDLPAGQANSIFDGQDTVSGQGLRISIDLDTNAPKKNRFYIVASGITPFETVQEEKESEFDAFLNIWSETIFGKAADLVPVARRVEWTANTFYPQYDDRNEDIATEDFFVIDTDTKYIFKCIENPATTSNTQPLSANNPGEYPSLALGTPFTLSDGYTWFFMGEVDEEDEALFGTSNYIPIVANTSVAAAAIDGGLFVIDVTTEGSSYLTLSGKTGVPFGTSTNRVRIPGETLNPSFYNNSGILVANSSGGVEVRQINSVIVNSSDPSNPFTEVELVAGQNFSAGFLQLDQDFIISPYVEITSKTGSGAEAYSVVGTDGQIQRIIVTKYGSGYRDATAVIRSAPDIGSGATIRPIMSPSGGHGSNILDELYVDSFAVASKFDANNFPLEAKYSTLALLKNPTYRANNQPFYGVSFVQTVSLPLDGTVALPDFTIGEEVRGSTTDTNTGRFPSGLVTFANSTLIQMSGLDGDFGPSQTLIGQTSGEIVYTANASTWSSQFGSNTTPVGVSNTEVKLYSGDILYAKNVEQITRSNTSPEQIKIVIKL